MCARNMLGQMMRELGLRTVSQLAARLGVSSSNLYQMWRGTHPDLRLGTVATLAQAAGLPPWRVARWWFEDEPPPPPPQPRPPPQPQPARRPPPPGPPDREKKMHQNAFLRHLGAATGSTTQAALARAADLDKATVTKILQGTLRDPGIRTFRRISLATGVPIGQLADWWFEAQPPSDD